MSFLFDVSSLKSETNMIYFLTFCISYTCVTFKPQMIATQRVI